MGEDEKDSYKEVADLLVNGRLKKGEEIIKSILGKKKTLQFMKLIN
jgi:hypothetical protein